MFFLKKNFADFLEKNSRIFKNLNFLTFIGYKQTDTQTDKLKYIDYTKAGCRKLLTYFCLYSYLEEMVQYNVDCGVPTLMYINPDLY